MRSVMKHSFSEVPRANIRRSSFNRGHGIKTTFDADYLVPILVDDIIPGDTFNCKLDFFARLATPINPIMDNLFLDSFFFFVPYRLVWDNWEKMHGAQDDPADSIDFTVPVFNTESITVSTGDLLQYMGIPDGFSMNHTHGISSLPVRAYRLIWNEWFRDQNLQDSLEVPTDDGPDSSGQSDYNDPPLKRGKRHDYFTSCLPWPQKGDAVALPLGTTAPVHTNVAANNLLSIYSTATTDNRILDLADGNHVGIDTASGTGDSLFADLSTATSATINDLRLAFQTQRLLERDARSGTRYNELILSHFGVTVPDFRLQRPEYLGGGTSPIQVQTIAQTSASPATPTVEDKLGNLGAMGVARGRHGFTKSFVEHGVLIGLVNVRADQTYSQGIERYWNKSTRYDFFYPVLATIGEQAVLSKEIYADGTANDNDVFGYQERYAEYRYKPSRLTGLFAVDATGSLSPWHLSEDFGSRPTLGNTFITSNATQGIERAIAVNTEPHIIFDGYMHMQCARPMPLFGIPGNLDRF